MIQYVIESKIALLVRQGRAHRRTPGRGRRAPGVENPSHRRHCIFRQDDEQNFSGTCADKKVKRMKVADAQKQEPTITCEGRPLKNVFLFKYLGSMFAADGTHTQDVERRIALAATRMGQLRHVFNSDITFMLKMKIYK